MNGKILKEKLRHIGKSQKELADMLGVTPQSVNAILSASDVRSGTIERLAKVLKLPMSYFYDDGTTVNNVSATGVNTGASVNGDVNIGGNERVKYLEELLKEKERTIQILMERK